MQEVVHCLRVEGFLDLAVGTSVERSLLVGLDVKETEEGRKGVSPYDENDYGQQQQALAPGGARPSSFHTVLRCGKAQQQAFLNDADTLAVAD